eukprot:c3806_g1_i1.p1 GENE.c3806_g1_i1~~c3806_g1_i1.p1  ORF type:complete len:224 (-),score=84.94 c3806_g1_i1:89-760(-)
MVQFVVFRFVIFYILLQLSQQTYFVSNVAFTDTNLAQYLLGGTVTWSPPSTTSGVCCYSANLYDSDSGTIYELSTDKINFGTNYFTINSRTPINAATQFVVTTYDSQYIVLASVYYTFVDKAIPVGVVTSLSCTDTDKLIGEISGPITWDTASVDSLATGINFYTSTDCITRSVQIAQVDITAIQYDIPNNFPRNGAICILAIFYNADGEAEDSSSVSFVDIG